jgi:hypothetical protein
MPYPTKRTPKVVEDILARISEGETLAAICRSEERFPCVSTWLDWVAADEELALAYARARDKGEEVIAESLLEIADDARNDYMEKFDKDGNSIGYFLNGEAVQRSKLRVETRLKLLAIWNPKKYGQKIDVTTKDKPLNDAPVEDIAARAASLLALAAKRKGEKDG